MAGVKRDNWEGGTGTFWCVGRKGEAGQLSDQIICQTDIMATCASLVGYDLPEGSAEDSFDLSPVLSGNAIDRYVRMFCIRPSVCPWIREGNWKYLDHKGSGGSNYNRDGEWGLKQYALPKRHRMLPANSIT